MRRERRGGWWNNNDGTMEDRLVLWCTGDCDDGGRNDDRARGEGNGYGRRSKG